MAERLSDPAEAEPGAVVQPRTEGLRVRPDLDRRRAERVGNLIGMASLEPAGAPGAMPDRHLEAGGDDLRVGDLHLPLLPEPVKAFETEAQDFFCRSVWMVGLLIQATVGSLGVRVR